MCDSHKPRCPRGCRHRATWGWSLPYAVAIASALASATSRLRLGIETKPDMAGRGQRGL